MRPVLRVVWITLALNLVVSATKIVIGQLSHNLTITADGFHSLVDASNNLMGLIGLYYSYRPPDANHPYGHRKIEAILALLVGGALALISWEILQSVFMRWIGWSEAPEPAAFDPIYALVLIGAFVINAIVASYEARQGRRHNSAFLIADSLHTRSDMAVTVLSLASLGFASRLPWLDGVLSLIVVSFIVHAGWTIIRDNALILTDAIRMDPEPIRRVAESVDGVENCHAIRSHGMPDDIHLDLHILVGPDLTAAETYEIETAVRKALFLQFPQVTEVAIHHQTRPPRTERPISRTELLENGEQRGEGI